MTGDSDRRGARIRPGIGRAVIGLLVLAALACGPGVSKNATAPSGVFGVLGGGTPGSNGGNITGTYRLQTAGGRTVPTRIFYDSTTGAVDTVFAASFDSSFISLNTDSSAREIDYLTIRDIRPPGDSNVNRTERFGDTVGGTYHVSGTSITLTLNDTIGGPHQVVTQFTETPNTITAVLTYSLYNTSGNLETTDTTTVVYDLTGPPLSDRLPTHVVSPRPGPSAASAVQTPLRLRAPSAIRGGTASSARVTQAIRAATASRAWGPSPAAGALRMAPMPARTRP
jgi:hypothetical protein